MIGIQELVRRVSLPERHSFTTLWGTATLTRRARDRSRQGSTPRISSRLFTFIRCTIHAVLEPGFWKLASRSRVLG